MRYISSLLFLFISAAAYSQINFIDNKTSWEDLSARAKSERKLLFVHFESDRCGQCNSVATQGFSNPKLKEQYARNFVALRLNVNTENGAAIQKKLGVTADMVSVYADADGNLLHQYYGTTSNPFAYLEAADVALQMRNEKPISEFEKEYQNGERSAAFLKQYIIRRKKAQLASDSLLEEYVGRLTVDSLSSFDVVKFIFEQAPILNSRAYRLMRAAAPKAVIDSVYKQAGLAGASRFNQSIIQRSIQKAIETKDINLAYETNTFLHGSYGGDYNTANFGGQKLLTRFYLGIKDTANYIRQARELMERNYMRLSVDSLYRIDEQEQKRQLQNNPQMVNGAAVAIRMAPPSQFYHIELNEHAWRFYEMAKSRNDLEYAAMWSKRSIEWFEEFGRKRNLPIQNPAYLDTYAHLLYKLGKKEEAIAWQTKAVEAMKTTNDQNDSIIRSLEKMKAGTL